MIAVGGVGGSGTRVIMMLLEQLGYNLGKNINKDSRILSYDELSLEPVLQRNANKAYAGHYEREVITEVNKFKGDAFKCGWNMFYLPLYNMMFRDFKYIHIIRDGRDIVCSSSHLVFERIMSTNKAKMWNDVNLHTDAQGRKLGDRYHLIRLEDLCLNQTVECLRLLDFLGKDISYLLKMLQVIKVPGTLGRGKGVSEDYMGVGLKHFGYEKK